MITMLFQNNQNKIMKKYKVVAIWPGCQYKLNDVLTLHPSGNEEENRYGCRVDNNWVWITNPELYNCNIINEKSI